MDLLNGVIKLSVCAYRPWIRSNLIEPAGDSKVAAFGGHWGNMLASFIMVFIGMTLYPVIIMRMTKEKK